MYLIKYLFIYLFILLNITIINVYCDGDYGDVNKILTPKIYSNIFSRRRTEQKLVIKHLLNIDNYEKKYKMVDIAIDALIKMIKDNKVTLDKESFSYDGKFPNVFSTIELLSTILENTGLFNEILIRIPQITTKIIKKKPEIKTLIIWATDVTLKYSNLIDVETLEMLNLLQIQYTDDNFNFDNILNDDIKNYLTKLDNDDDDDEEITPIETNQINNKKIKKEKTKRGPKLTSGKMEL